MFDPKATASHLDSTNSAIWKIGQSLPVYVQKQTILESALTSRSGHNRKSVDYSITSSARAIELEKVRDRVLSPS
jgi:hypothetical protein